MQQESILHWLLTRPAVARPSAEAAQPPGASAAPKRPRSPADAAPCAPSTPKRQCASASESTAPAEEPGGRAVAGPQERLPDGVEPQEGPGALGNNSWRGAATPCSTPSGLVDEDCEDNGRDRPESPPFTQLPTEEPLGNSQPNAPSTQEDTSSTCEDLDQDDEAIPTTFSQDGAVAPWELGPWVMRAPRTPSYTPPPPPPPGCTGSVTTLTAGVGAFEVTPADPYPPPLPPLPPPPPPPPPPSPPPPDVESASQQPPSIRGSVLYGAAAHYVVLGTFGQGVYGQVLHCREIATGRSRAIKVLRLEGQWSAAARNEARALARISLNDPDLHNLVRLYEAFERNNYLFLVLEALDVDLAAFMSTQNEHPLRMDAIAAILKQLFCALRKLEELDIIHADVKPSNIMLKPHPAARWRVKLVDFSNALSAKRALRAPSAQTICYRAPEVALGQAFCAAADVWSLGCVAAELATAAPLYRHARCDATLLHAVTRTHGPLPRALLARPGRTECFYTQDARGGWTLRELDTPNLFTWFTSLDDVCIYHISRLSEEEKLFFSVEIVLFRDLLRKMLDIYQETRLNPTEALSHIFLCGEYANYS